MTTTKAARPTRAWEMQTAAVMVVVTVATVLGMLLLVTQLAVWAYLRSGGASGLTWMVRFVMDNAIAFDVLSFFVMLGYIGGYFWWRRRTRQMLRVIGDTAGVATVHWTMVVWGALIFAAFNVSFRTPAGDGTPDGAATALGWQSLASGLRLAGLCLLLIGVWLIRAQVRRAVADAGVALRIHDLAGRPSSMPARPAPVLTRLDTERRDDLPPAGDEFWERASRLATGRGADIAVLETVGALARRWFLIPATGDVAAVRSAIAVGATVAVFPAPPAAAPVEHYTPPEAGEYYGFLEDAETGALWFQSVTPNRVPAFLARARSARRWALYPTHSPSTLHAVRQGANTGPPAPSER